MDLPALKSFADKINVDGIFLNNKKIQVCGEKGKYLSGAFSPFSMTFSVITMHS